MLRDVSPYPVHYPFSATKLGKQFQAAEELECAFAVIIDSKITGGQVGVKNLKSREQTVKGLQEALEAVVVKIKTGPSTENELPA